MPHVFNGNWRTYANMSPIQMAPKQGHSFVNFRWCVLITLAVRKKYPVDSSLALYWHLGVVTYYSSSTSYVIQRGFDSSPFHCGIHTDLHLHHVTLSIFEKPSLMATTITDFQPNVSPAILSFGAFKNVITHSTWVIISPESLGEGLFSFDLNPWKLVPSLSHFRFWS